MTVLYCILAALGAYVVFVAAPALVMYKCVFRRKAADSLLDRDLEKAGLKDHEDTLRAAFRYFEELPRRRVTVTAADGTVLAGDYYPRGQGKVVLCMHGYRSTPLNCFAVMGKFLSEQGFDVLLAYQRGHGESGGGVTSLGALEREDVLAWSVWLCGQSEVQQVVLAGVSMGCTAVAAASDQLTHTKLRAMILDCGFVSADQQIISACHKKHLPCPLHIIKWAARVGMRADITYPAWKSLERTRLPALFLHGTEDETVPVSCTETNYEHCAAPKQLYLVEGAHHADAFLMGGAEAERALTEFLNIHL